MNTSDYIDLHERRYNYNYLKRGLFDPVLLSLVEVYIYQKIVDFNILWRIKGAR